MKHQPAPGEVVTRTTCPYCGVGCGVLARVSGDGGVTVEGDPDHPANIGRLCAKGSALADTLVADGRLEHPEFGGRRIGWEEALDLVAGTFSRTVAQHGPESIAFYVSGQLLTEDYYLANKLMKGFIGTANIDTNSRLCMASSVAGHKRAFGTDTVPGTYEDLEIADLVVLVGSNLAWCHPVLHQRLMAARAARPAMRIVTIDPRRTATADACDLHLPIEPGSDLALFSGLLAHLADTGAVDTKFVEKNTAGFESALAAARAVSLAGVAEATGLPRTVLEDFYGRFAACERVVTVYSQGINQSTTGTDKVGAIINCHLATGRIGRPGMGPFSVTGQPNAMGGREVGGLANQLAAHGELHDADDRQRIQRFWGSPRIADKPGLKAVDLFRAIGDGQVKAVWIMATNPVDSLPDADMVAAALKACPFVVVSDVTATTDTAAFADVLLPAAGWGEKDGTVTNSERRISRQRPFRAAPGEARPDWWIIAQVARRMGFPGFEHETPAAVFREHAALSEAVNAGRRDFDIGGLADLSDAAFDALAPVQWPVPRGAAIAAGETRFFCDGGAFTPDRRLRFVAPVPRAPRDPDAQYPLILNTGRIRDQWHTMTRTGLSPRLSCHTAEPYCEIHPADAAMNGIEPATLVEVVSPCGTAVVRALVTDRMLPGTLFVPMHWTAQTSSHGRIGAVVAPATDPISGQPGLKETPARVSPFDAAWYGFVVSREAPDVSEPEYFAIARAKIGYRTEIAGKTVPADPSAMARRLLRWPAENVTFLGVEDRAAGSHRFAAFVNDRLVGAVWIARTPVGVSRAFASNALTGDAPDVSALLAGRPGADLPEEGAIVCTCFDIGVRRIERAVAGLESPTVEAVGALLRAGTNCGSCRPEIRRIVNGVRAPLTA